MDNIKQFLKKLGYEGKMLEEMNSIIDSDERLEDFKTYIIINDGRFKSLIQLQYMYVTDLKNKMNYTKADFIKEFSDNRLFALNKLLVLKPNQLILSKVNRLIDSGLTVGCLYDMFIKYKDYNPLQAVKNIEQDFTAKTIDFLRR